MGRLQPSIACYSRQSHEDLSAASTFSILICSIKSAASEPGTLAAAWDTPCSSVWEWDVPSLCQSFLVLWSPLPLLQQMTVTQPGRKPRLGHIWGLSFTCRIRSTCWADMLQLISWEFDHWSSISLASARSSLWDQKHNGAFYRDFQSWQLLLEPLSTSYGHLLDLLFWSFTLCLPIIHWQILDHRKRGYIQTTKAQARYAFKHRQEEPDSYA